MIDFLYLSFLLVFAHFLADYPLQGDYLSKAKNPNSAEGKTIWAVALTAHSVIHGGFVLVITGHIGLAFVETLAHANIDYLKCQNKIGYVTDQALHIGLKLVFAILIVNDLI